MARRRPRPKINEDLLKLAREASDRERARLARADRFRPLFGKGVRYHPELSTHR